MRNSNLRTFLCGPRSVTFSGGVSTEVGGTKTSLTYLWRRLKEIGVDTEVRRQIEDALQDVSVTDDPLVGRPSGRTLLIL